jgi:hypothetical protein
MGKVSQLDGAGALGSSGLGRDLEQPDCHRRDTGARL